MGLRQEFHGRLELALGYKRSKDSMTALVENIIAQLKKHKNGRSIIISPTFVNRVGFFGVEFDDGEDGLYRCKKGEREIEVERATHSTSSSSTSNPQDPITLVSYGTPFVPMANIHDLFAIASIRTPSPIVLRDPDATKAYRALQDLLGAPLDKRIVRVWKLDELIKVYRGETFDEGMRAIVQENFDRFAQLPDRMKFSAQPCLQATALEQEIHLHTVTGLGSYDTDFYRALCEKVILKYCQLNASGRERVCRDWSKFVHACKGELEDLLISDEETRTPLWPRPIRETREDEEPKPAKKRPKVAPVPLIKEDLILESDVIRSHWADRPVPPKPIYVNDSGPVLPNDARIQRDIETRKRQMSARVQRSQLRKRQKVDLSSASPEVIEIS